MCRREICVTSVNDVTIAFYNHLVLTMEAKIKTLEMFKDNRRRRRKCDVEIRIRQQSYILVEYWKIVWYPSSWKTEQYCSWSFQGTNPGLSVRYLLASRFTRPFLLFSTYRPRKVM